MKICSLLIAVTVESTVLCPFFSPEKAPSVTITVVGHDFQGVTFVTATLHVLSQSSSENMVVIPINAIFLKPMIGN